MIPILYESTATDFNNNGIGVLVDCVSCIVEEERNGIYECTFTYPITGKFFSEITPDRIVKVYANEKAQKQLFRIYRTSRPINGIVTFYCQHISYDLNKYVVTPFQSIGTSATAVMTEILEHCQYSSTDGYDSRYRDNRFTAIAYPGPTAQFKLEIPTEVKKCLGGMRGSVLDLFGGEYEWDNFTIRLHSSRGQDTGVTIRYGKNLTDIDQDIDLSSTYTSVYPYAIDADSDVITLDHPIVEIQNAPSTATAMTLPLDLSDKFDDDEDITKSRLSVLTGVYIARNHPEKIQNSIEVKFTQLWQTEEYKNIAPLEQVGLCDTVTVIYPTLNINVKSKVIAYKYNSLSEKYEEMTLGSARSNFSDMFNAKPDENDVEQEISATKSSLQKAIDRATKTINGQDGGYVYISNRVATNGDIIDDEEVDEDVFLPDGKPGEILIMDEPTISQAQKMWRWNIGGLGYSSNGYSGPFNLAITMQGEIVADFITTGVLDASIIKAGIIEDLAHKNYWNLQTGEFSLSSSAKGDVISSATQEQIYNILTNNSQNQGIYLQNGQLYINANMINTGYISANRISGGIISATNNKTTINLSNGEIAIKQIDSETQAQTGALKINSFGIMFEPVSNVNNNNNTGLSLSTTFSGAGFIEADYGQFGSQDTHFTISTSYMGMVYNSHLISEWSQNNGKSEFSVDDISVDNIRAGGTIRATTGISSTGYIAGDRVEATQYFDCGGRKFTPKGITINGTNYVLLCEDTTI